MYNEFQSIYISINRFIAIYFPHHYNKLCGYTATAFISTLLYADRLRNISIETYLRTSK